MSQVIEMGKTYRTRSGLDVELLHIADKPDADGELVVALLKDSECLEPRTWKADGRYYGDQDSEYDLLEVPETQTRWVNVYPCGCQVHATREAADLNASFNRIACIKIEFTAGEGIA